MMKEMSDRRMFIGNLSKGFLSVVLAFGLFKTGKSSQWNLFEDSDEHTLPKISPAFKMNVFADGKVELYTHQAEGEKVATMFQGLEADVLVKLSQQRDPRLYDQEMGLKYNLNRDAFESEVNSTLASLEDRGFIYYGETMLVKVMQAGNE